MPRRRSGPRSKPHNITPPLNDWMAEAINQNFDALFKDLQNVGEPGRLLDGTVLTDVLNGTALEGALIVGTVVSGQVKWAVFPIGATALVLRSNGTMPEWSKVHLTSDVDEILPVVNGGTGRASADENAVILGGSADVGPHESVAGLGDDGQVLTSQGPGLPPVWETPVVPIVRCITVVFDGGGTAITPGEIFYVTVPVNCELTGWRLVADQDGDIVLDVWKDTFANYPPVDADSITDGNEPEISGVDSAEDDTDDWLTEVVTAGDVIAVTCDSCTDIQRATFQLFMIETP